MKEIILVEGAQSPEDIFGRNLPNGERAALLQVKLIYRQLRTKLHPDHNRGLEKRAAIAFTKITKFYDLAKELLKAGTYGKPRSIMTITTKTSIYEVFGPVCEFTTGKPVNWSALGSFYHATCDSKPVMLKISKAPQFNDMLKHELLVVKDLLADTTSPQGMQDRFMKVIDSFETIIDNANRVVTVIENLGNVVSLQEILSTPQYLIGIPRKHIAWMWRRLLESIIHFENTGYTFGAAVPDNLLYNPNTHEIRFVDFCYAVKIGQVMTSIPSQWSSCYPEEVTTKQPTVPSTDTFIAAKTMLLAQQPERDTAGKILDAYFTAASLPSAKQRTSDALTLYNRYDDIIHNRLNWQKQFVVFPLSSAKQP